MPLNVKCVHNQRLYSVVMPQDSQVINMNVRFIDIVLALWVRLSRKIRFGAVELIVMSGNNSIRETGIHFHLVIMSIYNHIVLGITNLKTGVVIVQHNVSVVLSVLNSSSVITWRRLGNTSGKGLGHSLRHHARREEKHVRILRVHSVLKQLKYIKNISFLL